MDRNELEGRLRKFSGLVNDIIESLPNTYFGNNLAQQLSRSGLSPLLNYAEGQSAESRKDFIHKLKIVLKELRETFAGLKLIKEAKLLNSSKTLDYALDENNQLISIFVKSVDTATKNNNKDKGKGSNK